MATVLNPEFKQETLFGPRTVKDGTGRNNYKVVRVQAANLLDTVQTADANGWDLASSITLHDTPLLIFRRPSSVVDEKR